MSTKKQSKKLNKFRTSPLIAVIAIIEVLILVCACTFAWFVFTKNTTISTEFLSVEPDSGLEIDFNTADENDFVVINQYILDNFEFEPVTSTDGRNIFVPTTGSFGNDTTEQMAFREATVNDMNQKYICIDFTLTNTGESDMPVYLSTRSSFTVAGKEGKALRLAFYQNDGSSGDIDATYYQSDNADDNVVTVFFKNTNNWEHPYAYAYSNAEGDNNKSHNMDWPGVPITHISGDLYYYTFSTKYTVGGEAFNNELNRIIFSNGKENNRQTDNRGIHNNYIYTASTETNDKGEFLLERELYTSSIVDGTYPIVSPGVSVGFQRQYAPVTNIDNTTGAPTAILPAYANSIDNYSFSEDNPPLFTIGSFKTMSLSMIVWLEGTDPACTSDHYSGRDIDINLIFATKDSNDVEYSTYTFYDKTLETWIAHETPSSTGASVKPVMQLYDLTIDKGYLMKPVDYLTDDNGNILRAKTWSCNAPEEIMSENHDVVFRRVNPLDENEIWNYWDASGLSKSSATKIDGVEDTSALPEDIKDNYFFTAFADGSPKKALTKDKNNNIVDYTELLDYSCGGLWGKYDVKEIVVYDGTEGQYIIDTDKELEGYDSNTHQGALTINYEYEGQHIEYKASADDDKYRFVVPITVYSKNYAERPEITFTRYYNYNTKYALNSDKNSIYYHKKWEMGKCNGKFAQLVDEDGFSSYWGYDMLYLQTTELIANTFGVTDSDGDLRYHLQAHFYTGTSSSDDDHYVHLFNDDSYRDNGVGLGYACVIPSDKKYEQYGIELCGAYKDGGRNRIAYTDPVSLAQGSSDNVEFPNEVSNNIMLFNNLQAKIYFKIHKNLQSYGNNPWIGPIDNNYQEMTHTAQEGDYHVYYREYDYSKGTKVSFSNSTHGYNSGAKDVLGYAVYKMDSNKTFSCESNYLDEDSKKILWFESRNSTEWD